MWQVTPTLHKRQNYAVMCQIDHIRVSPNTYSHRTWHLFSSQGKWQMTGACRRRNWWAVTQWSAHSQGTKPMPALFHQVYTLACVDEPSSFRLSQVIQIPENISKYLHSIVLLPTPMSLCNCHRKVELLEEIDRAGWGGGGCWRDKPGTSEYVLCHWLCVSSGLRHLVSLFLSFPSVKQHSKTILTNVSWE